MSKDIPMRIASLPILIVILLLLTAATRPHDPPTLPADMTEALDRSDEITLYSIQPMGGPDLPEWDFHGQHQLGHVVLTGEVAKRAVAAFREAIAGGEANTLSACMFMPRHALRVIYGGDTYDMLICFSCGQLELYKNDQWLPFVGMIGQKPDKLDGILKDAGITLADTPEALDHSYDEEAKVALQRANAGDSQAQSVVGRYLISGRGLVKDEEEGIKWLAKAAGKSKYDP